MPAPILAQLRQPQRPSPIGPGPCGSYPSMTALTLPPRKPLHYAPDAGAQVAAALTVKKKENAAGRQLTLYGAAAGHIFKSRHGKGESREEHSWWASSYPNLTEYRGAETRRIDITSVATARPRKRKIPNA